MHSVSKRKDPAALKHLTYQELDVLHSLRGFCAFYVVIFHAKYLVWSGGRQFLDVHPRSSWSVLDYILFGLDMLSSAGYEMVILFFVLSGFFIRYAQLRKHRKPLPFYINRVARIYPPYLFASVLAVCVLWCVATLVPAALSVSNGRELNITLNQAWYELQALNLHGIISTLGFMPIGKIYIGYNDVYWSLLPEAIFYLMVPLFLWQVRIYYIASVVLHIVGLVLSYEVGLNPFIDYFFTYNLYFAIGAFVYDIVIETRWLVSFQRVSGWILTVVVGILFVLLLVLAVLKLKPLSGIVAALLAVISISALLVGKVSRQNILMRALHKLGVFSFSLYLYHFPLLLLCYGGMVYLTGETIFYERYYWLAVPLVTIVAYVLYQVTERVSVNYFRKV
ncbi:acyltransferase family protein [Hymenobacter mucosus]|uniref:Peptidoglycan/LPS O-acetylase OafA/YrhL, contains acyltransferase and SGNH-hydrolase domains n=1 Tax=Hymenobacter mucosus TaxID=1411120 RepID=A0A238YHF9_9BACT|nr:acyltransferase [Hymenobacter mucosus]SNR70228.1 Peptidoglycan/LPS O-acetylase OafA/YrhL, contains acyltransferase and SGNH-hydrolase domains [Hymenobacter mucosus]